MDGILPDLCTVDGQQWIAVFRRLIQLAALDHAGGAPRRTADGLRLEVGKMRVTHKRMLTTVYNQFRDELRRQDGALPRAQTGVDIHPKR